MSFSAQFLAASHANQLGRVAKFFVAFCAVVDIVYRISIYTEHKYKRRNRNEMKTYKSTGHTRIIRTYLKYLNARSSNLRYLFKRFGGHCYLI